MKACEVIAGGGGEELPLAQQQQQQHLRSPHPRTKRGDGGGKVSTSDVTADHQQQLKPDDLEGPSRSSLSSVESTEVVHVRRPPPSTVAR